MAWDQRPDRRTRRALLHLQYSCAAPCGPDQFANGTELLAGRIGVLPDIPVPPQAKHEAVEVNRLLSFAFPAIRETAAGKLPCLKPGHRAYTVILAVKGTNYRNRESSCGLDDEEPRHCDN